MPGKTTVTTKSGKSIESDLILMAVGVKPPQPSPLLTSLASKLDERNQFKVDEYLRVVGTTDVFAVGDCAASGHEKMVTSAIYSHGPAVAKSIVALSQGKEPVSPSPPMRVMMVPVGPDDGVGYIGGFTVSGMVVAAMKSKDLFTSRWWGLMGKQVPST